MTHGFTKDSTWFWKREPRKYVSSVFLFISWKSFGSGFDLNANIICFWICMEIGEKFETRQQLYLILCCVWNVAVHDKFIALDMMGFHRRRLTWIRKVYGIRHQNIKFLLVRYKVVDIDFKAFRPDRICFGVDILKGKLFFAGKCPRRLQKQ